MTDLEDRIHKVTVVLEEERARKAEVREERENGYSAHTDSHSPGIFCEHFSSCNLIRVELGGL